MDAGLRRHDDVGAVRVSIFTALGIRVIGSARNGCCAPTRSPLLSVLSHLDLSRRRRERFYYLRAGGRRSIQNATLPQA
jgi:hypothetical protein